MYKIEIKSKGDLFGAKNGSITRSSLHEAIELFHAKCRWIGIDPPDNTGVEFFAVNAESDDYTICLSKVEPATHTTQAKQTVYLSGPVSGIADLNKHLFKHAQLFYEKEGFNVINPLELNSHVEGSDAEVWRECMRNCIHAMIQLGKEDVFVMLPNWEQSRGAKFERELAEVLGIRTVKFELNSDTII
jgi:hypothetical protein